MTSALNPSPRRIAIAAVVVVALYRLLVWQVVMKYVPLIGDERYFFDRSRFFVRFWPGGNPPGNAIDRIVNRAWWLPGPSLLMAPIRAFTTNISYIRLWFGLVDGVLLVITAGLVRRVIGPKIALAFFLFIGFLPDAAAQSFGIWGEPIAAKLLLIVLLGVVVLARRNDPLGRRQYAVAAGLGAILGASVYFRPPLLLQVGTAIVALVVIGVGRRSRPPAREFVGAAALVTVGALAVLAPWSIAASDQNGGLVITTLSVDANAIHVFSNPEDLRELAGGVGFGDIERAARARMVERDQSYADALRDIRSELLRRVSFGDYWERADAEVELYFDGDRTFLEQYQVELAKGAAPRARSVIDAQLDLLEGINTVMWIPLALGAIYAMVRPFPLTARFGVPAIVTKISLAALMIQPYVSNAKFRHLGVAIPAMALFTLVALTDSRIRHADERQHFSPWAIWASRAIQALAAAMTAITTVVYLN